MSERRKLLIALAIGAGNAFLLPWYASVPLWISAPIFLTFLGLFAFLTRDIRRERRLGANHTESDDG